MLFSRNFHESNCISLRYSFKLHVFHHFGVDSFWIWLSEHSQNEKKFGRKSFENNFLFMFLLLYSFNLHVFQMFCIDIFWIRVLKHVQNRKILLWRKILKKSTCFILAICKLLTILVFIFLRQNHWNIDKITKVFCRGKFFCCKNFIFESAWSWPNFLIFFFPLACFQHVSYWSFLDWRLEI